MTTLTLTATSVDYCDDGLRLRHKVQKLRWMGLEREADCLVREIAALTCEYPIVVPDVDVATD